MTEPMEPETSRIALPPASGPMTTGQQVLRNEVAYFRVSDASCPVHPPSAGTLRSAAGLCLHSSSGNSRYM
jgi:hypothetical protein